MMYTFVYTFCVHFVYNTDAYTHWLVCYILDLHMYSVYIMYIIYHTRIVAYIVHMHHTYVYYCIYTTVRSIMYYIHVYRRAYVLHVVYILHNIMYSICTYYICDVLLTVVFMMPVP